MIVAAAATATVAATAGRSPRHIAVIVPRSSARIPGRECALLLAAPSSRGAEDRMRPSSSRKRRYADAAAASNVSNLSSEVAECMARTLLDTHIPSGRACRNRTRVSTHAFLENGILERAPARPPLFSLSLFYSLFFSGAKYRLVSGRSTFCPPPSLSPIRVLNLTILSALALL